MVDVLARNWGWVALRGIAALLFGLATLVVPEISVVVLTYLFGAFALAYGLFTVVAAAVNRRDEPQGAVLLISGVFSIGFGVLAFVLPGTMAPAVHYLVAGWSLLIGLVEIAVAVPLRQNAEARWLLLMAGTLSVGFGLLLIVFPRVDELALTLWIGAYAGIFGLMMVLLALALRRQAPVVEGPT